MTFTPYRKCQFILFTNDVAHIIRVKSNDSTCIIFGHILLIKMEILLPKPLTNYGVDKIMMQKQATKLNTFLILLSNPPYFR